MSARILVVDDEADVEALVRQQFRREMREGRYRMDFALSGADALLQLAENGSLKLILSDINMPGMSGLELLPRIKSAHPGLPVMMLTAYGDADTRRQALSLGALDLFSKPVDFAALKQRINLQLSETGG